MAKAAVGRASGHVSAAHRGAGADRDGNEAAAGTLALGAPKFLASLLALATATLIGHLILAPWGAGSALHILIPALGLWLARPRDVLVLGGVGAGLVIAGAFLTEIPLLPVTGLAGTALGLLAVATVTLVLYAAKRGAPAPSRPLPRDRQEQPPAAPAVAPPVIDEATPTAQIRHEVRTPLNAIIGFSEIARRELFGPLGNERYRSYMNDINAAAYQLLDVVERRLEGRGDESASGSRRLPAGQGTGAQAAPCQPETVPTRRSAAR